MKKVIIAGGSGFIGAALLESLKKSGYETVLLSRSQKPVKGADRVCVWDGKSLGSWASELENSEGLINLSGQSIMTRFTPEARKGIRSSRIESTKVLGAAIKQCVNPPKAWINASAIGIYGGDTGDKPLTEASAPGTGFLPEVCREWEKAMDEVDLTSTRKIKIRIGIVLGQGGGAFEQFSRITQMFAGGAIGTGRQYTSWIHIEDLVRLFVWAMEENVSGVYNGTAPNPETNNDFMAAFRSVYGRPPIPPAPAFLMGIVGRVINIEPELLTGGQRVLPAMAMEKGFAFLHPTLGPALDNLVDG